MSNVYTTLKQIAEPGLQEDGSYTRLAFSKEYFESIKIVKGIFEQLNLDTSIDLVGNVYGRWEVNPEGKTIIVGSHMDTVKNGGLYDGALGVACAIEVIRKMKEQGYMPSKNIELIGFNAEEGSPIGGTLGSRALMGMVNIQSTEKELFAEYGLTTDILKQTIRNTERDAAYIELHIEQGDKLYSSGNKIGIVTGIAGITRYKITAFGEANHAGTTMMDSRKDALVAMAKLITQLDEASKNVGDGFVATIGVLSIEPGSVNVIPGKAECILELRHLDKEVINHFVRNVEESFSNFKDVTFAMEEMIYKKSSYSDPSIVEVIENSAKSLGIPAVRMHSGAGHDTNAMATKMPTGMIFVPSKDGISHSGLEETLEEDIEIGFNLLYDVILQLTCKEEKR